MCIDRSTFKAAYRPTSFLLNARRWRLGNSFVKSLLQCYVVVQFTNVDLSSDRSTLNGRLLQKFGTVNRNRKHKLPKVATKCNRIHQQYKTANDKCHSGMTLVHTVVFSCYLVSTENKTQ